MKIGLVSAILEDYDFKKMIDTVSEIGYECVEVACWPKAKAERRYAGVSHIDVANLGDKEAEEILSYCKEKNVEISSLAFYPNTMDGNLEKRAANIEHLYKVIDASKKLGINLVTTFIGRDQTKTVEENLELVKKIWIPIVRYAEEKKVLPFLPFFSKCICYLHSFFFCPVFPLSVYCSAFLIPALSAQK